MLTISNIMRRNNFKLFLDIRIEESVKVKSIRTFLPARQVGYFVPMYHVALGAQLIDVAHFRIYGSKQETRVRDRTVAYIAGPIIPRKPHTSVKIALALFAFWGVLRGKELHYSCH